jgi:hypothetical protein
MPLSQINRNRIRNILIFLLLAALIALLVISLPLIRSRDNTRASYIQQIQKECRDAISDASTLSRTAGADSAANLSRIRSNIHSIRVVNNLSGADGNRVMLDDNQLMTIQNMVDRYLAYLTTGMDTGEYTTSLQTALSELLETVSGLN